jgi:nitrogen fixation protein FixH
MKRTLELSLILVILIFLSGCGQQAAESLSQTSGNYSATLRFDPDPPALMTSEGMTLTLLDSDGQPVNGAEVGFDLTMPAMKMPPNQPSATARGNGIYQTEATFTMAGQWQVDAAVFLNGETIHFIFSFDVE